MCIKVLFVCVRICIYEVYARARARVCVCVQKLNIHLILLNIYNELTELSIFFLIKWKNRQLYFIHSSGMLRSRRFSAICTKLIRHIIYVLLILYIIVSLKIAKWILSTVKYYIYFSSSMHQCMTHSSWSIIIFTMAFIFTIQLPNYR